MKYVQWASVKGTAKGVDTLESFRSWSTRPEVKGTYRAVKVFDSATAPEGYRKPVTKAELREQKKALEAKAKAPEAVIATPPTPPEAKPLKKLGETPTE